MATAAPRKTAPTNGIIREKLPDDKPRGRRPKVVMYRGHTQEVSAAWAELMNLILAQKVSYHKISKLAGCEDGGLITEMDHAYRREKCLPTFQSIHRVATAMGLRATIRFDKAD